jgi:hypothetical protein
VNGEKLDVRRFCEELEQLAGPWDHLTPTSRGAQARVIFDRRRDATLVAQAVQRLGLQPTEADVDAGMPEDVSSVGRDVVREQLRARLSLDRLVASRGRLEVTEADVAAAQADPSLLGGAAPAYAVDLYLARTPAGAQPELAAAARTAALSFAEAVSRSEPPGPTAARLGLTGPAPAVLASFALEPALYSAVAGLARGEWSGAVETRAGWAVAMSRGEVAAPGGKEAPSRDEVRRRLENLLRARERARVLAELRGESRVEMYVRF